VLRVPALWRKGQEDGMPEESLGYISPVSVSRGLGCRLVVEYLPRMHKVLGSILTNANKIIIISGRLTKDVQELTFEKHCSEKLRVLGKWKGWKETLCS
jgi:hypothetical protein